MAEDTYLLSSQYDIIENARASPLILADGGSLGGMLERQGLSKIREILAYLGQIKDEPPLNSMKILKFLECEKVNKNSKRALHGVNTRNECLK